MRNIYFLWGENMARRIVVTSGKGGVGKTTFVCCFGESLSEMGFKVLLVDMDFGLNNLDVVMGVENKVVYDIIDVIEGRCLPRQALIQDFYESGLFVLPTTHGFCSKKFGSKELLSIIKMIESDFDFVIIDCPAGIDGGFLRAVECGGEHIVMTSPYLSAIRDGSKIINKLCEISLTKPYLVVNRARGDMILDGDMVSIEDIKSCLPAELLGVIPEDDEISKQLLHGGRFNKSSSSKESIDMICSKLIYGTDRIFDCTKKYKGFWGNIRKGLRKRV